MMLRATATTAALALLLLNTSALAAGKDKSDAVSRGGYLVKAMGCSDCHTPMKMGPKGPEPDVARGLSGHPEGMALPPAPAPAGPWIWGGSASMTAFHGPWGITYSPNLTPDKETGIGLWPEEVFVNAMRTGKHMGGGRPILPPMPWQSLNALNDSDLRAVFRYLMAQPPVKNAVPAHQPPPTRG